jgi:2-oxoglutarate ferredoxin oxidoreductase subunit alpha
VAAGRPYNHISSINLVPEELEPLVLARFERYKLVKQEINRYEEYGVEGADLVFVAYGTSARVCLGAIQAAEKLGIKLGLFRPISLWPFPYARLGELSKLGKRFLCVEMSMGQMIEDVRLAAEGRSKIDHYGRVGGMIPSEEEVLAEALRLLGRGVSGAKEL